MPGAHVRRVGFGSMRNLLARSSFLERRTDIKRRAFRGQHHREQPLPAPPANTSEVVERSSFHQEKSVDAVGFHQPACLLLTLVSLPRSDRLRLIRYRRERRDRRGERRVTFLSSCKRMQICAERGASDRTQLHKTTPGDHSASRESSKRDIIVVCFGFPSCGQQKNSAALVRPKMVRWKPDSNALDAASATRRPSMSRRGA